MNCGQLMLMSQHRAVPFDHTPENAEQKVGLWSDSKQQQKRKKSEHQNTQQLRGVCASTGATIYRTRARELRRNSRTIFEWVQHVNIMWTTIVKSSRAPEMSGMNAEKSRLHFTDSFRWEGDFFLYQFFFSSSWNTFMRREDEKSWWNAKNIWANFTII